jgi:D-alanine-D-alanine ligase
MAWKREIGKLWDKTKILMIDGDFVRSHFSTDFTEGGHGFVYDYVPKDEIWVEAMINKEDQEDNFVHECVEYIFMKYLDKEYETAHDMALKVESASRLVGDAEPVKASDEDVSSVEVSRKIAESFLNSSISKKNLLSLIYEAKDEAKDEKEELDYNNIAITVFNSDVSKENDEASEWDALMDVEKAFKEAGYEPPKRIATSVTPEEFFENISKINPSVVLNFNEYLKDKDVMLVNTCNVLDLLDIPYTGASSFATALTTDKFTSKAIMSGASIRTPKSREFPIGSEVESEGLDYPLFVKPVSEDGSKGIDEKSIVKNIAELTKQVEYLHDKIKCSVMVEEFIDGREAAVAIIGNDKSIRVLPICETDLTKTKTNIVSDKGKNDDSSEEYKAINYICPSDFDDTISSELIEFSKKAYKIFRCRDYARFDFRITKYKAYMIEVNTNPDLCNDYNFKPMREAEGLTLWDILKILIDEAYSRA